MSLTAMFAGEKKDKLTLILSFEHGLLWMYSIDMVESEKDWTK